MKAGEALTLFSKWQKTKVNSDYVKRLGVAPFLSKQYGQLSTGQKRKAAPGAGSLGKSGDRHFG